MNFYFLLDVSKGWWFCVREFYVHIELRLIFYLLIELKLISVDMLCECMSLAVINVL